MPPVKCHYFTTCHNTEDKETQGEKQRGKQVYRERKNGGCISKQAEGANCVNVQEGRRNDARRRTENEKKSDGEEDRELISGLRGTC